MELIRKIMQIIQRERFMIRGHNQSGLTLIELLIAMVVAGMLLAGMVMAFTGQSRTYNTQQEVSALQEDLKASLQLMSRDIRMAGFAGQGTAAPAPGILTATNTVFRSTQNLNEDGDTADADEDVAYSLNATTSLRRSTDGAATYQPVMDNITNLGFEYLLVTDPATPGNALVRTWTFAPTAAELPSIQAVRICIQGRTLRQTSSVVDNGIFMAAFYNADGTANNIDWSPATAADRGQYQWRTMCMEIQCRNRQ
jgi:type IV pilus assembly protein PilW